MRRSDRICTCGHHHGNHKPDCRSCSESGCYKDHRCDWHNRCRCQQFEGKIVTEEGREPSPTAVAAEVVAYGLIEAEAKARKDEGRAWLLERMGPELLAVAAQVGDRQVGKASYSTGSAEFKATDMDALAEFVAEHYPTEVQTITSVNAAFLKRLLGELKNVGGTAVDGNGLPVPGVTLVHGKPRLTVTKAKDARDTIAELLADGRVSLDGFRELEQ